LVTAVALLLALGTELALLLHLLLLDMISDLCLLIAVMTETHDTITAPVHPLDSLDTF